MTNAIKDKLRPVYQELHGLYISCPNTKLNNEKIYDSSIWDHYHGIICEINEITGENYDKFKVEIKLQASGLPPVVYIATYKTKLTGLISRLYGSYFSTEMNPLTSAPSTQTTINQFQSQTQHITIEFEKFLDEKIKSTEDEDKKSFLTRLKDKTKNVSDIAELIKSTAETARDLGVGIAKLVDWFS